MDRVIGSRGFLSSYPESEGEARGSKRYTLEKIKIRSPSCVILYYYNNKNKLHY